MQHKLSEAVRAGMEGVEQFTGSFFSNEPQDYRHYKPHTGVNDLPHTIDENGVAIINAEQTLAYPYCCVIGCMLRGLVKLAQPEALHLDCEPNSLDETFILKMTGVELYGAGLFVMVNGAETDSLFGALMLMNDIEHLSFTRIAAWLEERGL